MLSLTRRRDPDRKAEHWLIFAGDIEIGSIGMRAGVPNDADQWQWTVAVYPASHRGICDGGTAKDFQEARAAFERSWREIEPMITEADRTEQRRERAHTAWKYKMWDTGCKLPTQVAEGRSRCFCGAPNGVADVETHVYAVHLEHVGC